MKNLQALLKNYYNVFALPLTLFDGNATLAAFPDQPFLPNPAERFIKPLLGEGRNLDVTVSRDFVITGYVRENTTGSLIIAGPVMEFPCKRQTAYSILADLNEPPSRADQLLDFFSKTPSMTLSRFLKHLILIHQIVNEDQPPEEYATNKLNAYLRAFPDEDRSIEPPAHNSQAVEQMILSLIEHGKTGDLIQLLKNSSTFDANMGITASDSLRSFKNIFVASTTLATRAAVRGGLDYETAMNLSDDFLNKMEALNNYTDIEALWRQMLVGFASLTERYQQLSHNSKLVHSASNYILAHINDKISTTHVADALGLNRSYLSRRFRQETGKNLIDCINEVKIDEACHLLTASDLKLGDIAYRLGFSSQNYFQTVFRKVTGSTPRAYRIERA